MQIENSARLLSYYLVATLAFYNLNLKYMQAIPLNTQSLSWTELVLGLSLKGTSALTLSRARWKLKLLWSVAVRLVPVQFSFVT